ncbi:hypothetical protein V8E36_002442 [Tilletia maclaganii]
MYAAPRNGQVPLPGSRMARDKAPDTIFPFATCEPLNSHRSRPSLRSAISPPRPRSSLVMVSRGLCFLLLHLNPDLLYIKAPTSHLAHHTIGHCPLACYASAGMCKDEEHIIAGTGKKRSTTVDPVSLPLSPPRCNLHSFAASTARHHRLDGNVMTLRHHARKARFGMRGAMMHQGHQPPCFDRCNVGSAFWTRGKDWRISDQQAEVT